MERVTLARQYAKALYGLCPDQAMTDRVAAELETAVSTVDAVPGLHGFLYHPEIPFNRKQAALTSLLPPGFTEQTLGLLSLLARNRYLRILPAVLREFLDLRQERYGLLRAEVEAVRPLSDDLRERLKATLHGITGHPVEIREKTNPELVGGVRIRIGDRIVDGSVTGRLRELRDELFRRSA